MTSPEYAAAFNEVKLLGGDGIVTPTSRTDDQTEAGFTGPMTERPAFARLHASTTRSR